MKYKIATTMEQSLKLIELGLNVDTADMMYKLFTHITNKDGKTKYAHYTLFTVEIMPTLANFDIGDIEELEQVYKHFGYDSHNITKYKNNEFTIGSMSFSKDCIPAWSLGALLAIIPKKEAPYIKYLNEPPFDDEEYRWECGLPDLIGCPGSSPIEAAFQMVCWLLENGYIGKGGAS